jgi:uncharacterized protein
MGGNVMNQGRESTIYYFERKGPENTDRTLDISLAACDQRGIKRVIVASSSGETALRLKEKASPLLEIIAVTYGAGSKYVEEVEAFNRNRPLVEKKGILIVKGIHALSGTERTFENKYKSGFIPLNIVADTLRMFSQGMKVCVEAAVMAAEHGFVKPEEDVVVAAGTGHGADTAVVLRPGYAASMFETKIRAVLCMPE